MDTKNMDYAENTTYNIVAEWIGTEGLDELTEAQLHDLRVWLENSNFSAEEDMDKLEAYMQSS